MIWRVIPDILLIEEKHALVARMRVRANRVIANAVEANRSLCDEVNEAEARNDGAVLKHAISEMADWLAALQRTAELHDNRGMHNARVETIDDQIAELAAMKAETCRIYDIRIAELEAKKTRPKRKSATLAGTSGRLGSHNTQREHNTHG